MWQLALLWLTLPLKASHHIVPLGLHVLCIEECARLLQSWVRVRGFGDQLGGGSHQGQSQAPGADQNTTARKQPLLPMTRSLIPWTMLNAALTNADEFHQNGWISATCHLDCEAARRIVVDLLLQEPWHVVHRCMQHTKQLLLNPNDSWLMFCTTDVANVMWPMWLWRLPLQQEVARWQDVSIQSIQYAVAWGYQQGMTALGKAGDIWGQNGTNDGALNNIRQWTRHCKAMQRLRPVRLCKSRGLSWTAGCASSMAATACQSPFMFSSQSLWSPRVSISSTAWKSVSESMKSMIRTKDCQGGLSGPRARAKCWLSKLAMVRQTLLIQTWISNVKVKRLD